MSVQGGVFSWNQAQPDSIYLQKLANEMRQFGPDMERAYINSNVALLYGAFWVTEEDEKEEQPCFGASGSVATWDGRLDNRDELALALGKPLTLTDAELALAVWERWGEAGFSRLKGDWAMVIWDSREQRLLLSHDHVGVRTLFYTVAQAEVRWCTSLRALVLASEAPLTLSQEYIAGYLLLNPEPCLTPFKEIRAVPPSSFVELKRGNVRVQKYWSFAVTDLIRMGSDTEYEEQFRVLLLQSVRRRLRSKYMVFAELSGGLDSSSIVCLIGHMARSGEAIPKYKTLSYLREVTPENEDARFVPTVESWIGQEGYRVDPNTFELSGVDIDCAYSARPGYTKGRLAKDRNRNELLEACGARTLLCGIGGDELLGGVMDPMPSLVQACGSRDWSRFWKLIVDWSIWKRIPIPFLLAESLVNFIPLMFLTAGEWFGGLPEPRFLTRQFRKAVHLRARALGAAEGVSPWRSRFYHLSQHTPMAAFLADRQEPSYVGCYARLYPFLDRDFMEFLTRIPQEQIARPGHRRHLMRRALVGLVPSEILNRKTKAIGFRELAKQLQGRYSDVLANFQGGVLLALNIVDEHSLETALRSFRDGCSEDAMPNSRLPSLERWLQEQVRLARLTVERPVRKGSIYTGKPRHDRKEYTRTEEQKCT
jgi:asparagine synthase (glutamine-hydrolysing)